MALLDAGIEYHEALSLGYEQMLCLLHHRVLDRNLEYLNSESVRIAGLMAADPSEQQQMLVRIKHLAAAELDEFYRIYKEEKNESSG